MPNLQAELIDYWQERAKSKGIHPLPMKKGANGKAVSPYARHAAAFVTLIHACGDDATRARRAIGFYFEDTDPFIVSAGWDIGPFTKRMLGYVHKVKAEDDRKSRALKRAEEAEQEAAERGAFANPSRLMPRLRGVVERVAQRFKAVPAPEVRMTPEEKARAAREWAREQWEER